MAPIASRIFDFVTRGSVKVAENPNVIVRSNVDALKTLFLEIKVRKKEILKKYKEIQEKKKVWEQSSLQEKEKFSGKLIKLNQRYGVLKGEQFAALSSAMQQLESAVVNLLAVARRHDEMLRDMFEKTKLLKDESLKKRIQIKIKQLRQEEKNVLHDAFLGAKALQRSVVSTQTVKKWSFQGSLVKLRRIRRASVLNDTIQRKVDTLTSRLDEKRIDKLVTLGRQKFHNIGNAIHKAYQLIHRLQKIQKDMPDKETEEKFKISLHNLVEQTRRAWADIK